MSTARTVIKNWTLLLLCRVISIGLGIGYVAVLARYIHAAGMGKIATAISLVSLLILLANFGLNQLIVRDVAGDKTKAGIYVSNTLLLRGLLSLLFGVVIICITRYAKYPQDTIFIIYIYSIAYIFDTLTDLAFSIFNAFEKMEYQAFIQTGRDVFNVVLSISAISLEASLITIVVISALANLLKLILSMAVLRWRFVRPKLQVDLHLCRNLLVTGIPFAILAIIGYVDRAINTVLLSFYHPEEVVGWFSAANTMIDYLLIVPSIFLQVIFPVFAKFHNISQAALQQSYRLSFKYLFLIGFPLCAGTIATSDQMIVLIYGSGFENAALVLKVLAFLLFIMFGYANGALLIATGGQTFLVRITGIGAGLNVLVAFLLIPQFSFLGASIAAIAPGVALSFPIALACHKRLGLKFPYVLATKAFFSSATMGIIVELALRAQINLIFTVLAIGPIVYGMLLVALRVIDRQDMLMLTQIFKRRTSLEHEK